MWVPSEPCSTQASPGCRAGGQAGGAAAQECAESATAPGWSIAGQLSLEWSN